MTAQHGRWACWAALAGVVALVAAPAAAAKPSNNGNGPPPHAGIGNPHAPGATGNPHAPGTTGNPHQGSPPYGVANGHARTPSSASAGRGAGTPPVPRAPGGDPGPNPGAGGPGKGPRGKTTLCHATNSSTNPYTKITVSNAAVKAHLKHGDFRAPGQSCDESRPAVQAAIEAIGGTLGESATGGTLARAAASEAQAGPDGELPYTGIVLGALASIGIMLLFGAWLLRRLEGEPRSE